MYGSILVRPGDTSIVYPPEPGIGICAEPCTCLFCNMARHDAERKCPTCGQPLGFGAIVPLRREKVYDQQRVAIIGETRYPVQFTVWSAPHEPILEHLACYEARQYQHAMDVEAQRPKEPVLAQNPDVPPIPPLTTLYVAHITAEPDGGLARLFRFASLIPEGVDRTDPAVTAWLWGQNHSTAVEVEHHKRRTKRVKAAPPPDTTTPTADEAAA